jgi:alkylation response protein AidB-like acyl-CoA dehydrogenase
MSRHQAVVPYAEPAWVGFPSPYYTESHRKWRAHVRAYVEKHLLPHVDDWEDAKEAPAYKIAQEAYRAGIYASMWPLEYGGKNAIEGERDGFHEFILYDELARTASGGLQLLFSIKSMALPPILNAGPEWMKKLVLPDVLSGRKFASLAITEPYTGSDVAAIRTTATRLDDTHFLVNGQKKWITMGCLSHYFTTAVQTEKGFSILLLTRDMPGISVRKMNLQGNYLANTAQLIFEDVKVPIRNLIGVEGQGFKAIMTNFNHERFVLSVCANRNSRVCLEESIKYARVRKTFKKRLVDHQVIRHKIAEMTRAVETTHALLEQTCFLMDQKIPAKQLGGICALAKVQCSRTFELCAREASQIFGGNGYLREGKGKRVERLYREVRAAAIPGGSEEILLDLAMKSAKL